MLKGKHVHAVLCFQIQINDSSASHHVVTVGSTNFYLPYNVKIQSFNPKGRGPESPVKTIMSAEERKYTNVPNYMIWTAFIMWSKLLVAVWC